MSHPVHSVAKVMAEYLRKENLATDPLRDKRPDGKFGPWPVFADAFDTDPDEAIGITTTGRPTSGRLMRTGETIFHWQFQTRVRSKTAASAFQKVMEVFSAYDQVVRYQLSVEDKYYQIQSVSQMMAPTNMGKDPNNRHNFVLNSITTFKEVEELE